MLVLDWSHTTAPVLAEDDEFDTGADEFEEDAEYDEEDEADDYEYEEYDDYAEKWDVPKQGDRSADGDLKDL